MSHLRCLRLIFLAICVLPITPGCSVSVTPTYPSGPFAVTPPFLAKDLLTASRMTPSVPTRTLPASVPSATPSPLSATAPVPSRTTPPTMTTPAATATSASPIAKLPPPLAAVSFPSQVIGYPPDWHPDLRYPNQFSLVETVSGISPRGVKGWAVKLVYQGEARVAVDLLSNFFASKGWQTLERTELDSKGFLLLVQKDDKHQTGAIVIDPDTERPGYVKIVATVFP